MGTYGRVGGRRRGNAAWQWLIIGFFPGLLCGGLVVFGLVLSGVLQGFATGPTPTPPPPEQIVQIVTATVDPNMPTTTPMVITATSEPTDEVSDAVMIQQTPTEVAAEPTVSTPEPTQAGVDTSALTPQNVIPTVPVDTTGTTVVVPPELANNVTRLISIPGGTYRMGTTVSEIQDAVTQCLTRDGGNCLIADGEDSTPQVEVQISDFQMEQTEVTFGQYVQFLNYLRSSQGQNHLTGCGGFICIQTLNERPSDSGGVIIFDGANYEAPTTITNFPVYAVSWYGAKAYCEAIGRRLPTESEWEYAARSAGGDFIYPWGNDFSADFAKTRIPVDGPQGPVAVGTYPNRGTAQGLLDMAGNIAEWVSDWYIEDYYTQLANTGSVTLDPQGPPTGLEKVLRGGSWNAFPFYARTVHRLSYNPLPVDNSDASYPRWIGFRCAADANVTPVSPAVNTTSSGTTTDTQSAAPTLAVPSEETDESSSTDANRG
ncbi:MAG: SUMF1/EgtB/PvdO family nonheme iron enzyme [Anaerolineae bacterium]|nr:SUMF1/EgtB/PvdO family nonheme iron enzyme [Anaerolineae bacterium]